MTNNNGNTAYMLLSDLDKVEVRGRLLATHKYFFHGTPAANLHSIRQHGLHPRFESEHSSYGARFREPDKAIRYCTNKYPDLALSAAGNRTQVWEDSAGMWVSRSPEIIILRAKAESLLNRSFGLDHSFGEVKQGSEAILESRPCLTPDEFVGFTEKYGSISCYECIPPGELEICIDVPPSVAGQFGRVKDDRRAECQIT